MLTASDSNDIRRDNTEDAISFESCASIFVENATAMSSNRRSSDESAAAADALAAGKERNRRFTALQASFKETEARLLARCETAESAQRKAANTPSAEMAQAVGEAIEEAEAAMDEAKRESEALRGELEAARDTLEALLPLVTRVLGPRHHTTLAVRDLLARSA